jgi:hypothetical protein
MGILLNSTYWAGVAGEMWKIRPVPNRVMSKEDTVKFLTFACRALDDLIRDHELSSDLERIADIVKQHFAVPYRFAPDFENFIEEFSRAEAVLLMRSGMSFDCADDLVNELRRVARFTQEISPDAVYQLHNHLGELRDKTCRAVEAEAGVVESDLKTRSVWRAVKGWAAIGIDSVGATAAHLIDPIATGPIVAASFAAASIGYGTTMVTQAKDALSGLP